MRITLYKYKDKMLQYDTKHKKYVIRFTVKSTIGPYRYTLSDTLKGAIKLLKKGYH